MEGHRIVHEKAGEREEGLNVEGKLVVAAVAAEDEEGEDGAEEVDGAAAVAAACGGDKGIVGEKGVGVGKEDRAPMEETVDAVEEIQTVAAVAC